MRRLRFWSGLGLVAIALIAIVLSIFLGYPSNATSTRNQQMLDLGLIDRVVSARDLGLDYLQQETEPLMASLLDNIKFAEAKAAQMTQNIDVAFDLGTNDPIRVGSLPDQRRLVSKTGYSAVGYINNAGLPKTFTPSTLRKMFSVEWHNRGQLVTAPEAQETLVADASLSFLQAQRIPTFDLIVYSKRHRLLYLVPQVNANAVCRDALNGVLNHTLIHARTPPRRPRRSMPLW